MSDAPDVVSKEPGAAAAHRWLSAEIPGWVRDGLVSQSQAGLILSRYSDAWEGSRQLHRLRISRAFASLGATLIGIGVVLVIGVNWQEMPRALRLAILMLGIAGFYASGYYLAHERKNYPSAGEALMLVGSLLFGASVFLVGQMYHQSGAGAGGEWIQGLMWWFIGVLPLAYVLTSQLQMSLALAVGTVWLVLGLVQRDPGGAFYPHLVLVYALGCLLTAAGALHSRLDGWRELARTIGGYGLLYVLGSLYLLTHLFRWEHTAESRLGPGWEVLPLALTVCGAVASLVLLVPMRSSTAEGNESASSERWEGLGVLVACLIGASFIGLAGSVFEPGGYRSELTFAQIFSNVALLAAEIGLIALGWRRMETGMVNLGLGFFFVHLMTRYFDLIGTMLSGGVTFIVTGIVLLGFGWALERGRRRIIETMRANVGGAVR